MIGPRTIPPSPLSLKQGVTAEKLTGSSKYSYGLCDALDGMLEIGCQYSLQMGSDWPQTGQMWDVLRSVSVHFGSPSQSVLKMILKSLKLKSPCKPQGKYKG